MATPTPSTCSYISTQPYMKRDLKNQSQKSNRNIFNHTILRITYLQQSWPPVRRIRTTEVFSRINLSWLEVPTKLQRNSNLYIISYVTPVQDTYYTDTSCPLVSALCTDQESHHLYFLSFCPL